MSLDYDRDDRSHFLTPVPAPDPTNVTTAPAPKLINNLQIDSCLYSENLKPRNRIISPRPSFV